LSQTNKEVLTMKNATVRLLLTLVILLMLLASSAPSPARVETVIALGNSPPLAEGEEAETDLPYKFFFPLATKNYVSLAAEGYDGPPLVWPFAVGHNWQVTAGYNTYCHGGDCIDDNVCLNPGPGQCSYDDKGDKFTFDLFRIGGGTVGHEVRAVQDGMIWPWIANGLVIQQIQDASGNDTGYYVYYGHVTPAPNLSLTVWSAGASQPHTHQAKGQSRQ
jgi:hypothetical protein